MKYLHYINDQQGNMIESVYSPDNKPKFSMECMTNIKKGEYKIYNRESNEIINVKLSEFFKEL